ncbi:MAG: 5-methyltetrahydropteroyltriglutamate--homocysteine S-methyltransferase [Verrucomicrobia bacterium RIFCSPHIGHO2_12_FULL_41_10]|nr:MAG: 5-methyltetrahydropteroyltriglutamate--homocysteine S-methyltransferase [Verrucomicrobia bacterium RIFCSPHIGHO2_12_FULL_41_10]
MTIKSHILGFPRIGAKRELKRGVEAYWRGEISQQELHQIGQKVKEANWQIQHDAGLDFVTVGDFSWYDQVLDASALLGVIPDRFGKITGNLSLDTYFCMARGQAPNVKETTACEMTKWFNTNYHYIVPELTINQEFRITSEKLFDEIKDAQQLGHHVKPVVIGPLTYLWLSKSKGYDFDKLTLLEKLIPVYNELFARLNQLNVKWVQIDEPILVLDLPKPWLEAYNRAYRALQFGTTRCLLATYFGAVQENLSVANQLPVHGLHLDLCSALQEMALPLIAKDKVLSLGIVNGRNIWRTDLEKALALIQWAKETHGDRLWISTSCSLMHSPVDLDNETLLDAEFKSWLAFAKQKVAEVALLTKVQTSSKAAIADALKENQAAIASRTNSPRVNNQAVQARMKQVMPKQAQRTPYAQRAEIQRQAFQLPLFPTTTIGSFPQTKEIRTARQEYKAGRLDENAYTQAMRQEIAKVISQQEALGLDVLVHGEAERNDMVEYFGELLNGFSFTAHGWVQSYGSRCVKPPIIYGDVSRLQAMTVPWSSYAQSLTKQLVKGMLTGPVTILAWSFVRDDQSYADTALQIALALRDEVTDLEKAGIHVIQIDEPAFREILPLRKSDWQNYFDWAVYCFRIASSGVEDKTQIHTHMCYCEFNDVIQAIADLDADVITLESSRSEMELLKAFETFAYPNEMGPGVYDIHSPRVPSTQEIIDNLERAIQYIPATRLWVNPDCGLKTRNWPEVIQALSHMVEASKCMREKYSHECAKESSLDKVLKDACGIQMVEE